MKTVGCLCEIKYISTTGFCSFSCSEWITFLCTFFLYVSFCFSFETCVHYSSTLKSIYGEISRYSNITFTSVNEILFMKYNLFGRIANVCIQDEENITKHHEKEN